MAYPASTETKKTSLQSVSPAPRPGPPPRTHFRSSARGPGLPLFRVSLMVNPLPASAPHQVKEGKLKPRRFREPSCHSCLPLPWLGRAETGEPPSYTHGPPGRDKGGSLRDTLFPGEDGLGHQSQPRARKPTAWSAWGGTVPSQTQSLAGGLRTCVHMCKHVTRPPPWLSVAQPLVAMKRLGEAGSSLESPSPGTLTRSHHGHGHRHSRQDLALTGDI